MLENFFITGTAHNLIVQLGNQRSILGNNTYYHTVSDYMSNDPHTSQLSAFSAPLVCTTAKMKLKEISHILLCIRIPELHPLELIDDKKIELAFNTEWYFILDLIRRSILLFNTHETDETRDTIHKGRVYITLPHLRTSNMTNTQVLFYKCIVRAIKTLINILNHNSHLILVYVSSMVADRDNALSILKYIETLHTKHAYKKIYFQTPFLRRILGNH